MLLHAPTSSMEDVPEIFPSPFRCVPHAITSAAVQSFQRALRSDVLSHHDFDREGKMLGVLIVQLPDRSRAHLRGFSGQIGQSWQAKGFVPPLFNISAVQTFLPQGQERLDALSERIDALTSELRQGEEEYARLCARIAKQGQHFNELMRSKKNARAQRRLRGELSSVLQQESREDSRLKREHRAMLGRERKVAQDAVETVRHAKLARTAERTRESSALLEQVFSLYDIQNARGETKTLANFSRGARIPGGTGDCAGAKLIGYANANGLKPLALAEFWWGAPPPTGGRYHGVLYPSCRGKCGKILPYMLDGLNAEPEPQFGNTLSEPGWPKTLYEDAHLLVVEKPEGLLSVPGRTAHKTDSVLTRLQARYQGSPGPFLIHRLDLGTSGLLIAAKDKATESMMGRLMNERSIHKEYIALVRGCDVPASGEIDLPLWPDLCDRPRQVVDPLHGKSSKTYFAVLSQDAEHTRLRLVPHSGRTHQLRVHCANHLGLNRPIVGDTLYGHAQEAPRMMLHASRLRFTHPYTNKVVDLRSPAPF